MPKKNINYGLKYLRIYEDIKEKIVSGKLKPSQQLLSFRQMMEFYEASYRTVAQALDELEKYKLITRTQGRGIFVAPRTNWNIEVDESKFVGLIVTEMNIPFFGRIIHVVENELAAIGYNVVVRNSNFDSVTEQSIVNEFVDRGFHGTLIVPTFDEIDTEFLSKMQQKTFPILYVNRFKHDCNCSYIVPDDYAGAQTALDHLFEMGHRKIGYLSGEMIEGKDPRFNSYVDFIKRSGLPLKNEWVARGPYFEIDSGYNAMREVLNSKELPSAMLCYSDSMAAGGIKACKEMRLKVPKDISFIGCNNDDIATIIEPNLTTILNPIEKIAKLAVKFLIEQIEKPDDSGDLLQLRVPMELIKRNSVQKIS